MSATRVELQDLLQQRQAAKALDLSSRKRVLTDLSGSHLSGFRGRGMEFDEHRPYSPGDEVRTIDWRVTARTGQTYVRGYREERERPVIIACDQRQSMQFGSRGCFKSVLAARAAATLAWAAMDNGDRIGGLIWTAKAQELKPYGGRRGVLRYLHALQTEVGQEQEAAPLSALCEELRRLAKPGSLVFLISDFHDFDDSAAQQLQLLSRHCELLLCLISDPLERQAPQAGLYPVQETNADKTRWLNTADKQLRKNWQEDFEKRTQQLQEQALRCRAPCLHFGTEEDLNAALQRSFGQKPGQGQRVA